MAWSTKGAIIGDLQGLQVNRHYPHHSPFICSFWEQDLSILQDFLRIYGFEGAAPKEGEDVTRTSESSYRRPCRESSARICRDRDRVCAKVKKPLAKGARACAGRFAPHAPGRQISNASVKIIVAAGLSKIEV